MQTFDIISIIANVILMAFSLWGAYRSCKYYDKSKYLSTHTNLSKALLEIEKMQMKVTECLSALAQKRRYTKGYNFSKAIGSIGKDLSDSLIVFHSYIPSEYTEKLSGLERTSVFRLQKFVNDCLSEKLSDMEDLFEKECISCQERLAVMQDFIKGQIDKAGEKLK